MTDITLWKGDITKLNYDAIVNAANTTMRGGGGVDGAIHRAAGPELLAWETLAHPNGLSIGHALPTPGFKLLAKYIIHTVGPDLRRVSQEDGEWQLIAAYVNSFFCADELGCKTVAFPAISTGVYAYPMADAADVAIRAIRSAGKLAQNVETVTFALFDDHAVKAFEEALAS